MNQRINRILNHPEYQEHLIKIANIEKERTFCKHDLTHFLDTARICYIVNLEKKLNIPKDMIYAAALLHDIGKWQQYEMGISHEIASATLCKNILLDVGYNINEIHEITVAIQSHRDAGVENERSLSGLLFVADKLSRKCLECTMKDHCDWPDDRKNRPIIY